MTVLERLKAAGYDPAVSLFPDSIGNAGSMECERIQIRTFFCRPRENEAAIGVTATAMTHFSDGSTRPYPDGWPRSLEASVTLYFAGDAGTFIILATSQPTLSALIPSSVTGS